MSDMHLIFFRTIISIYTQTVFGNLRFRSCLECKRFLERKKDAQREKVIRNKKSCQIVSEQIVDSLLKDRQSQLTRLNLLNSAV